MTNGLKLPLKIIVGFTTMLPMGLFMGIPFPTGICKLKDMEDGEEIIPLMWGVNGLFSVVGSVLAVIVSMTFGFTMTLYAGAGIYLLLYLVNPLNVRGGH